MLRSDWRNIGCQLIFSALYAVIVPTVAAAQSACEGVVPPVGAAAAAVEVIAGPNRCAGIRLDTGYVMTARHCVEDVHPIRVDGTPHRVAVALEARGPDPTVGDLSALWPMSEVHGAGAQPGFGATRPGQCLWIARADRSVLPCTVLGQLGDRMELRCTTQDGDSGAAVLMRDAFDGAIRVVGILSGRGVGSEAGIAVANGLRALRPLLRGPSKIR